jgi:hypothetical protein
MAATTSTASAANANGSVQFGGPGWSVTIGSGNYNPYNQYKPGKFCQPIVKKVKWWDRFGYPHWSQVVVGQKCPPKFPPHNNGPFPPHHNGGWNNGGWNNGGWNGHGGQGW